MNTQTSIFILQHKYIGEIKNIYKENQLQHCQTSYFN